MMFGKGKQFLLLISHWKPDKIIHICLLYYRHTLHSISTREVPNNIPKIIASIMLFNTGKTQIHQIIKNCMKNHIKELNIICQSTDNTMAKRNKKDLQNTRTINPNPTYKAKVSSTASEEKATPALPLVHVISYM